MKVYVSGPMTGYVNNNVPAFNKAARQLRALGYEVVNPAELDAGEPCSTWEECLRRDIKWLVTCDAIANLNGWKRSRGATLENHIGEKLSFRIHRLAYFLRRKNV